MTMDSYYYQSYDYSTFGAIPPATSTDFDLPYSSIFDPEEDQQLLLDLQSFLSDSNTPNNSFSPVSSDPYYNSPAPHHTESALHPHQFHLDFDYSLFPLVQEPYPFDPPLPEPDHNYYFTEPAPKRQKCFHFEPPCNNNSAYSGFLAPPLPQEIFLPKQEAFCACGKQVANGGFESTGGSKGREGGARATAQSVAARDRRKRISDKTQELGKLVPGAANSKMNTAEMLQSAFQYVKFLQAQVSVLQLMGSDSSSSQEEGKEGIKTQNLKIVASSAVQEKLYMKDKCLVPVEFLEQLAGNGDVQRQSSIAKDLKQLMKSISVENC